MTDHVHPTAFGQIAIAERALSLLARNGMRVALAPHELVAYEVDVARASARGSHLLLPPRQGEPAGLSPCALGASRWRSFWDP